MRMMRQDLWKKMMTCQQVTRVGLLKTVDGLLAQGRLYFFVGSFYYFLILLFMVGKKVKKNEPFRLHFLFIVLLLLILLDNQVYSKHV